MVLYQYHTQLQRNRRRDRLHAQLVDLSSRINILEEQRDRQLAHLDAVILRRAAAEEELERRVEEGRSVESVAQAEIRLAEMRCDEVYWAQKVRETVVGLADMYTLENALAHSL